MTAKRAASSKRLVVRQVRSAIGYNARQKATLRAMGLGGVGQRCSLPDNAQVRGMIARIPHLVQVVDNEAEGDRA